MARKLGRRVVDVLTDPLIGGIHAGSVDDMSAAATFPPLLAAADRRGSLMRALRAEVPPPPADGPPLFWSLRDGTASMVQALAAALAARGVEIRLSEPVHRLDRGAQGWVAVSTTRAAEADAVVLATPANATAQLVRPHDDEAATLLEAIDYASVTVVTFRAPPGRAARIAPGHRLPRAAPQPTCGRRPLVRDGLHVPRSQMAPLGP